MIKLHFSLKSAKKILSTGAALFLLSIGTSQCFAQSESGTANGKAAQERQFLEIINTLYYYIEQNYVEDVDPQKLYEGALRGMLESLGDPYSTYMDSSEWRSLTDITVGNFGGVGLSISKPSMNNTDKPAYVQVVQPIDGTPGAKAGILAGDLITEINGIDTSTITMDEVLGMLRGKEGESVTVKIRRGKATEFECTLVRAIIENPTIKYDMIGKTGYIRISDFSSNTAKRFQEALDSFENRKYTSLIIDLRDNGGGLLSSAVDIADKFIDSGVIVSTKSRIAYENQVYTASPRKTKVKGIPVIVLVNGNSASASEILAGALKDTKSAYLVGTKTFGKGSVQIPRSLVNNDGFKITVARYYSPSDSNIDKVGIPPDREISYPQFTEEEEQAFVDLMNSEEVADYVEQHPNMTEDDISFYAEQLRETYPLESRTLRKIIRNETDRTKPSRLYDLDYDLQLNEALYILEHEDFKALMSTTKTLKDLEQENAQ